jgi:competence protein ComEC
MVVAHALDAQAATDACAIAAVIVIDDATAKNLCRWKDVLVVTSRDLALRGSAAIFLPEDVTELTAHGPNAAIAKAEFAISRPFRPWHEQRKFSRAARGLPPYQRKPAPPSSAGAEPNPQLTPTPPATEPVTPDQ